jgi:serine protease
MKSKTLLSIAALILLTVSLSIYSRSDVSASNLADIRYAGRVLYVDSNAPNGGNGSRQQPFNTIQSAIDQSSNRAIIKVASGTYFEELVIEDKTLSMSGGFDPQSWLAVGNVTDTIIDGNFNGRAITIFGDSNVSLEGFSIINSYNDCISSPAVFQGAGGGGILVIGNSTRATIDRVLVKNNIVEPPCGGGGIETNTAEVTITNAIVVNNSANDGGGINIGNSSQVEIRYSTFSDNWPDGIGVEGSGSEHGVLTNTISFNNGLSDLGGAVQRLDIITSLISVDPLFVDPANGDYHLKEGSPAIDAGTIVGGANVDIDGDRRPIGKGVDIGADEFRP